MSALPKLFSDAACTQELAKDGSQNYILSLGPDTGLDGNAGEVTTKQLWLKNAGDEIYQNVTLSETGDAPSRVSYSLDNVAYQPAGISFGNIAVNATVSFHVKVTVEAGAAAGRQSFSFQLTGESI